METGSTDPLAQAAAPLAAPVVPGGAVASARRFLGQFGLAVMWQVLGKLIGVVGLSYAYRCLGPDNVGVSGTVLMVVTTSQLALDFGLDIVAVRHAASRTLPVPRLMQALFSLRLVLALGGLVVFGVAAALLARQPDVRWVWWFGALHLAFLNLNFSWYFQATGRVPLFSLLQNITTVATTVVILLLFRPGQRVGSDLVVTMAVNAATTVFGWLWIRRREGTALFDRGSLELALQLFREARPTWVFNLTYNALSTMGLPLCKYLLSDREAGYYRSVVMLVTTLQVFLNYFALMLNPRIVQWRAEASGRLRGRLLFLTGVLVLGSVGCLGCLWLVGEPLILLLWGKQFLPALALTGVASVVLIPCYGIEAAAWLNFGGEFVLLILCFWALNHVERQRTRAA